MQEQRILSIDDSGQIVIPKALRTRLGLAPGMKLIVQEKENGDMTLRREETPTLVRKGKVLVVVAEPLEDLFDFVTKEREQRIPY